ncbi:MAG: alpha/beta fold hydrolase [Candidatus Hodarchaeota archaeon]
MSELEGLITHRCARFEDVKLHFVEAGSKNNPLVILLHGFPDFWYSWRHQIPHLAKNYHVVALDQRGYNLSSKPRKVSEYNLDKLTGDVRRIIEYLGKDKAFIIGHDWGGAISWEFTHRYPELVEKLVIINCPPFQVLMEEQLENFHQLKSSYYIYAFQIPFLPEKLLSMNRARFLIKGLPRMIRGVTEKEVKEYEKCFSIKDTLRSGINYYRAVFRTMIPRFLARNLDKIEIKVPTHIIWGYYDFALQATLTRKFPAICKAGYSIKFFKGGHFVHQELKWASVVNESISQFLK